MGSWFESVVHQGEEGTVGRGVLTELQDHEVAREVAGHCLVSMLVAFCQHDTNLDISGKRDSYLRTPLHHIVP